MIDVVNVMMVVTCSGGSVDLLIKPRVQQYSSSTVRSSEFLTDFSCDGRAFGAERAPPPLSNIWKRLTASTFDYFDGID